MSEFSKESINERIRQNRFEDVTVTCRRADGSPLGDTEISVGQTSHAFGFGAIGFELVEGKKTAKSWSEDQIEGYKERMLGIMNYATMPFYWQRFEPEEGKPITDAVMKASLWFKDHGFTLKGHPLCWHEACAPWHDQFTPEQFMERQLERIRRDVSDFAGVIDSWDVINEVVRLPMYERLDNAVTRACPVFGAEGIAKMCFDAARETNPDATLLLNDYNLSPEYEHLLDSLIAKGASIDVIGLQTHQHQGYQGAEFLWDVCERFSRFDLPLHFTETTILSGQLVDPDNKDLQLVDIDPWPTTPEGEERQCEEVTEFYSLLYSHPSVEAIVWWGIADGGWLGAPNGLVRRDMSPKPAYESLQKLIKGEWWTPETSLKTDSDGGIAFRGAYGTYAAKAAGSEVSFDIERGSEAPVVVFE